MGTGKSKAVFTLTEETSAEETGGDENARERKRRISCREALWMPLIRTGEEMIAVSFCQREGKKNGGKSKR